MKGRIRFTIGAMLSIIGMTLIPIDIHFALKFAIFCAGVGLWAWGYYHIVRAYK